MTFEKHVACTKEHCELAFDYIEKAREGVDLLNPSIDRSKEFKEQLLIDREKIEQKICKNIGEAMQELLAIYAEHITSIIDRDKLMAQTVMDTVDLGMMALTNLSAKFTLVTKTFEIPPEAKRAAEERLTLN